MVEKASGNGETEQERFGSGCLARFQGVSAPKLEEQASSETAACTSEYIEQRGKEYVQEKQSETARESTKVNYDGTHRESNQASG